MLSSSQTNPIHYIVQWVMRNVSSIIGLYDFWCGKKLFRAIKVNKDFQNTDCHNVIKIYVENKFVDDSK